MIDGITGVGGIGPVNATRLGATQPSATASVAGPSFSAALTELATKATETVRVAEAASRAGIKGELPLQEVVASVMEAERTLHTAIAVRDKVVAAYLEISRMQI